MREPIRKKSFQCKYSLSALGILPCAALILNALPQGTFFTHTHCVEVISRQFFSGYLSSYITTFTSISHIH